jgi:nicotinamidase/pyrazinamidase
MKPGKNDVLLVIDVQNDFCPGGALAVPDGDSVVPDINRMAGDFGHCVLTQDWHPAGHSSFATTHSGKAPFSTISMPYGEQTLWPDHCIQGSKGAEFHPGLDLPGAEMIIRKGYNPEIDSYSAFFENDRKTPTGLAGYLGERGLKRVFCVGLATDFCVRFSAEDARKLGLETVVVLGACRGIDLGGSIAAGIEAMKAAGATLVERV